MIFGSYSAGSIRELALTLANDVFRRFPAAIANSPEPPVSQRRRAEILENVFSRAGQLSRNRQFGFLARIRLGSALKWRLKEMGYDEKFIELAAQHLVASITHPQK